MALPMVHLMAARSWAQDKPELRENPDYYLGAISPDAVHIRDHDDKSHKDEIHLHNWMFPHTDEVVAYWRDHHTPFDIGYGIHVLTDAQWVPRYRERLPQLILPGNRVDIKIYYNDTFVTDFLLYREEGGAELMDLVNRGHAPQDHPLLGFYEFDEWRKAMVSSYRGECPMHDPVRYVDRAYVMDFLADCNALFDDVYQRYLGICRFPAGKDGVQ